MSRLQRVRANLRKAYDTGRESVRLARIESDATTDDNEVDFEPPPPDQQLDGQSTASRDDAEVPHSLRLAAAWAWRLIVVGVVSFADRPTFAARAAGARGCPRVLVTGIAMAFRQLGLLLTHCTRFSNVVA